MRKVSFSGFLILIIKKINLISQLIVGVAWVLEHQIKSVETNIIEDKFFAVFCNTC